MKAWKITFYTFTILPLSFIVSLLAFYFRAANILGHTPAYNQPDPKELDIYSTYAPFIDISASIWLFSFLPWLILVVVYLLVNRKDIWWKPIIMMGVVQLVAVRMLFSGIFEWYVD